MRVLITGGNGYVGSSLYDFFKDKHEVTSINRKYFDLSNFERTKEFFKDEYFDVVLHCAISGGSRLKEDTVDVVDNNLKMYYSLLNNRGHYGKLINFGSGAELNNPESFYGKSKSIISQSIKNKYEFYNVMIYAVFGEKELDTRFIKSNIKRYIDGQPIKVNSDKRMTFFYIEDLCKLVDCIMSSDRVDLEHLNWASYAKNYSLVEIANIINSLGNHRVDIEIGSAKETDYVSPHWCSYPIEFIGLEKGIEKTYEKLKNLS